MTFMAIHAGNDHQEQAEWAMSWHLLFLTGKILEETSILLTVSMWAEREEHEIAFIHGIIQQIFVTHLYA